MCFEFRETKHCHCLRTCRYFHEGYDCIPFFRYGKCHRQGNCGYMHRPHLIELLKRRERMLRGTEGGETKKPGELKIMGSDQNVGDQTQQRNSLPESGGIDEDVISLPSDTESAVIADAPESIIEKSIPSQNLMAGPALENSRQPINEMMMTDRLPTRRPPSGNQSYSYGKASSNHYRSGSPIRDEYARRRHSPPSYDRDDELANIERELPPFWFAARDRGGRIYFYNESTRETTWENPVRRNYYVHNRDRKRPLSEVTYPRPLPR